MTCGALTPRSWCCQCGKTHTQSDFILKETLNNSLFPEGEAVETDLIGKQAGFSSPVAVFAWRYAHFPFSGRTLGVGVGVVGVGVGVAHSHATEPIKALAKIA